MEDEIADRSFHLPHFFTAIHKRGKEASQERDQTCSGKRLVPALMFLLQAPYLEVTYIPTRAKSLSYLA